MAYLLVVFVFWFGAIIGSFLNVLIWRLPLGSSPAKGRSACPHCHHTLGFWDLVPILSFLVLGGRCRYCKAKISYQYPVVELLTGLLFVATWWRVFGEFSYTNGDAYLFFGSILELISFLKILFVISLAIVVAVIDFKYMLILDRVVVPATIVLLVSNVFLDVVGSSVWSLHSYTVGGVFAGVLVALFFGVQWVLSKGQWIGLGDVKFAIPFGLALGWPGALFGLVMSYWLGALVAIPLLLAGRGGKMKLPFGVFLAAALIVCILFETSILSFVKGFFLI